MLVIEATYQQLPVDGTLRGRTLIEVPNQPVDYSDVIHVEIDRH